MAKINQNKTVAVYSRVSTGMQNVGPQEKRLRTWAESVGYTRLIFFRDISTGATLDRPGIRSLFAAIGEHRIDVVVVERLDRLGRRLVDLLYFLERLQVNRIDFVSLEQNLDTRTSTGRIMFKIIAAFSEFERDRISERVREGLQNAREDGIKLGRPELPLETREKINLLYAEGLSVREISTKLGISTATTQKYRKKKT